MKRETIYSFILATSMLLLTACGSDSKSDSGDLPPSQGSTSLSIVYESSEYDEKKGMIDHYHVHAVDENADPIKGLSIDVSLVNGVKEIGGLKLQNAKGNILSSEPIGFSDYNVDFSQTTVGQGDTLMIIPAAGKTNNTYLGDWKISGVAGDLTLSENSFHLETTENLTYVIGNDERFLGGDTGRGTIAVAHIENPESTTDTEGYVYFDVVFDPILAGHTITVGAHTSGNRMGMAKVGNLRGGDFFGSEVSVQDTGSLQYAIMRLVIDTGNGGTENLIDLDIVPSSFIVEPASSCSLNESASDLHTDAGGRVLLAINTTGSLDENVTEISECTVTWEGGASSIYLEY